MLWFTHTHTHTHSNDEAVRMLESLKDLMEQKQKAETVSFEKNPSEAIFKKPKPLRRLSKKDISAPCNFKHVSGIKTGVLVRISWALQCNSMLLTLLFAYSLCVFIEPPVHVGITLKRTQTCEEELRGTIQRKMRSMSLSNLSRRKVTRKYMYVYTHYTYSNNNGILYAYNHGAFVKLLTGDSSTNGRPQYHDLDVSPTTVRRAEAGGSLRSARPGSLLHKFGSLRLTKKKPYCKCVHTHTSTHKHKHEHTHKHTHANSYGPCQDQG